MDDETRTRQRRLRRMKWFMRHLPRRSQLAKIPIVGRLMGHARQAKFLWSFHMEEIAPAFLVGWVITLSPFFGLHTLLVVLCVFLFRANIIIPLALQLVSTPLTLPILWPVLHAVGKFCVHHLSRGPAVAASLAYHPIVDAGQVFARGVALIALGGILVGFACTFVSIAVYAIFFRSSWEKSSHRRR
jgi:uncharacterized protein (DUF2062 family)